MRETFQIYQLCGTFKHVLRKSLLLNSILPADQLKYGLGTRIVPGFIKINFLKKINIFLYVLDHFDTLI